MFSLTSSDSKKKTLKVSVEGSPKRTATDKGERLKSSRKFDPSAKHPLPDLVISNSPRPPVKIPKPPEDTPRPPTDLKFDDLPEKIKLKCMESDIPLQQYKDDIEILYTCARFIHGHEFGISKVQTRTTGKVTPYAPDDFLEFGSMLLSQTHPLLLLYF